MPLVRISLVKGKPEGYRRKVAMQSTAHWSSTSRATW
jgi:hypothetical protein